MTQLLDMTTARRTSIKLKETEFDVFPQGAVKH